MRIAQVSPYSWSRPGGVREHVIGLSAALVRRGLDVEVIAPDSSDGLTREIEFHSAGRSVPVRDNASVVPVALSPAAAARTARLVRSGAYDLVHVHEPMIPTVSLAALLAAQVPVVGTFHMYAARPRWYRPFAPLARRAIPRLAARIAVSEAARWHVARTVPGDYAIIPNGIDFTALAASGEERAANRLLFIGRAEPRKGLAVLLDAFSRLAPAVQLDLAGVSAEELDKAEPALSEDVALRVHPLGFVDAAHRARRLARAAVLCVPSLQGESFGIVLVEGMAAGTPVVASDVAGYGAILPEGAGRLVPPGDASALAQALEELLADAELRAELGRAGREEARRYDWSRVTEEIVQVYEQAAAGR